MENCHFNKIEGLKIDFFFGLLHAMSYEYHLSSDEDDHENERHPLNSWDSYAKGRYIT